MESLSAGWQRAFEAAGRALRAAAESLPGAEIRERETALRRERDELWQLLADVARTVRGQARYGADRAEILR